MKLLYPEIFSSSLHKRNDSEYRQLMQNYFAFIDMSLKLSMFVPCDEDENPLQNPNNVNVYHKYKSNEEYLSADIQYQKAKEKVLFEGFSVSNNFENELCLYHLDFPQVYSYLKKDRPFSMNYPMFSIKIKDLIFKNFTLTPNAVNSIFQLKADSIDP